MNLADKRECELKMLELNMSMRYCVDGQFKYITLGKPYSVYGIYTNYVQIKNDIGELSNYSLKWFEKI